MKATLLLKEEHDILRLMLDRMRRPARGHDKTAQVWEFRSEMEMHWRIEEELLYPELENKPSRQAATLVSTALRHSGEIEKLLKEMTRHFPAKKFDSQIAHLAESVGEYLRFEEDQIFEEARQCLSEFRMEQLGLEMEDRRRFLTASAA